MEKTPFEQSWENQERRQEEIQSFLKDLSVSDWRAITSFLAYSFVATHAHVRRSYMPSLPKETLDRELLRWYYDHLKCWLDELPERTLPVTMENIPKIRMLLELHAQGIRDLLAVPREDWPLLYGPPVQPDDGGTG